MPTDQIEENLSSSLNWSKKKILITNFLGGLAWGFGTVVGASVVAALLIWFLSLINFVPIVGNFTADIVRIVNQKNPVK